MSDNKYINAVKCCPILFQGNKTFSFECGDGWAIPLERLCLQLEELNEKYSKYHISIFAEQIKEKFGTLRFYYATRTEDSNAIKRFISRSIGRLTEKLRRVNYRYKSIVDEPSFEEEEVKELEKKEFLKEKNRWKKCTCYKFFLKDGKFFRSCKVLHCAKTHLEPTEHKLTHKLYTMFAKLNSWVLGFEKYTDKQEAIRELVVYKADKLISDAEKECMDYCEVCGKHIGDGSLSARCETQWWIRYVCEDCAVKMDTSYYKNGALYNDRKCIMSKKKLESKLKNK